jgi:hypothetical protein
MASLSFSEQARCECIWYWHEPLINGAYRTMLVSSQCYHFWRLPSEVRKTVFQNEVTRNWKIPSYEDMGLIPVKL